MGEQNRQMHVYTLFDKIRSGMVFDLFAYTLPDRKPDRKSQMVSNRTILVANALLPGER